MSVQVKYFEDDYRLIASVHHKDISSSAGINSAFDELNTALAKIREKIGAENHWYFLIDFVADGAKPIAPEFDPNEPGEFVMGSHNPWQAFCPAFWNNVTANPQFHDRAIEWIGRIEETLKFAESLSLSTASLWEDDETQFGEPLLTHLALTDVQFVPYYTKILRLWDLGHEVHQGGAIVEIVNRYGVTPETKELILYYTEASGSDDLGLLELLGDKWSH